LELGGGSPVQVDFERQLNSVAAIAQPIYQHAHGPRTVRHPGSEFQGRPPPPRPQRCPRRTGRRTPRRRPRQPPRPQHPHRQRLGHLRTTRLDHLPRRPHEWRATRAVGVGKPPASPVIPGRRSPARFSPWHLCFPEQYGRSPTRCHPHAVDAQQHPVDDHECLPPGDGHSVTQRRCQRGQDIEGLRGVA
jgi:hypothetical protein